MMTFSAGEIFSSVVYALIYGIAFAMMLSAIKAIKEGIYASLEYLKNISKNDRIFSLPSLKRVNFIHRTDAVAHALSILLFAVGFSLLSYLSLDGQIRLYMLIFSFASFYMSKNAFFGFSKKIVFIALGIPVALIAMALRITLKIIKRLNKKDLSSNK